MVRSHRYDIETLHQFAKPSPDAVALGRATLLFRDGEADPDRTMIVARTALQDEGPAVRTRATGNGEEVRPLP
jgi:hypothetical protein